jgi:hypothetical protein
VRKLAYALAPLVLSSCGGTQSGNFIGAGGGTLCLPDNSVCIIVPLNGLPNDTYLFIKPSSDTPAGALSPSWQIGPDGTLFLAEATVVFTFSDAPDGGLPVDLDPAQLRIYTRDYLDGGGYGDWVPLDGPIVNRVLNEVSGTTPHLSPFVLLRADRLPDGGIPIEGDAGMMKDAGPIDCPPPCMSLANCMDNMLNGNETDVDCGGDMCGQCDNGKMCVANSDCKSGRCGMTSKTCRPIPDAGMPDAGEPDSGTPDAGEPDAGTPDAGTPDAGTPDAGPKDAGTPDAGPKDAGTPDAGPKDAGTPDAGTPDAGPDDAGCADSGDGGC